MLAFCTVSAVLGNSTLRGLTSLFIGLAMGLGGCVVGSEQGDQVEGQAALRKGNQASGIVWAWRSSRIERRGSVG